jgi:TonB family protein
MSQRVDILDQHDALSGGFIAAFLLHAGVVVVLTVGWFWMHRARETLGEVHPAGGPAYDVAAVSKIPIPQRDAPQNPVAADTQSTVRSAPAKEETEKKIPVPDKDAFQIPDRKKKQAEQPLHQQQYMQQARKNQVYSRTPTAVASPMYGASGSGQVGIGPNSPLGTRLGWYAEIVRQQIAQQWLTNGLDSSSQRAPAMVSFTIMRDGSVKDVRVLQSSGNPNIDNTAQRAVYQAKLPPLPGQVTDSSITAQFTFNLR